jgi:hypothetical protein
MGAQAASPTGSQVYYDTSAKKYYTLDVPQNSNMPSGMYSMLSPLFNIASDSSQYRNYINIPSMSNANQFTYNYPDMNNLFPGLNAGLSQNLGLPQGLMSPTQTDGAMYGAGRFLAPQTTNTQGK